MKKNKTIGGFDSIRVMRWGSFYACQGSTLGLSWSWRKFRFVTSVIWWWLDENGGKAGKPMLYGKYHKALRKANEFGKLPKQVA